MGDFPPIFLELFAAGLSGDGADALWLLGC